MPPIRPISMILVGLSIPMRIQFNSSVPPARNADPLEPASVSAPPVDDTRAYSNGSMVASVHLDRSRLDCFGDLRIGRTAAEISAHPFPDLYVRSRVPLFNAAERSHDLPRRAEPTLKGVAFYKGPLHRMQRIASRESLDCRHATALQGGRENETRVDSPSVQHNRTGTALSPVAPFLGTREVQLLPQ